MNQPITIGDLLHWTLLVACIGCVVGSAILWFTALGSAMSDTPSGGPPAVALFGVPVLAVVVGAAWWFS